MTRREAAKIIEQHRGGCADLRKMSQDDISAMLDTWELYFSRYKAEDVLAAVISFITTSNSAFFPGVAQIIGEMHKTRESSILSESEAWAQVRKAVGNSLYGYQNEFDRLPEETQRAIGSAEMLRAWAMSSIDEVDTVISSNFQRAYRCIVERKKHTDRLPESVRQRLETAGGLALCQRD